MLEKNYTKGHKITIMQFFKLSNPYQQMLTENKVCSVISTILQFINH